MKEKKQRFIPIYIYVLWAVLLFSIVVYIISLNSVTFSDFYNRYPGAAVRAALSYLTSWLPLSLTELVLILAPASVVFFTAFAIRHRKGGLREALKFFICLLTCASMFFSVFVLGFGCGYHGSTLDVKLGLEKKDVAPDELRDTAIWVVNEVNESIKDVSFPADSSKMPYSLTEMNKKLLEAYDAVCDEYDFVQRLSSRVKPVMMSEAMSYTHITGVYTYFSGEANININFPDYTIPFTAAHELAHQRGIAREDEANLIAFLVCIRSDDAYIKYSGYLNMFEYIAPKLSAQKEVYAKVYYMLDENARREMSAYAQFFKKYQHSVVGEVSNKVNNTYLQIQGTVGTKSYGMVVDLTVAYYKAKIAEK